MSFAATCTFANRLVLNAEVLQILRPGTKYAGSITSTALKSPSSSVVRRANVAVSIAEIFVARNVELEVFCWTLDVELRVLACVVASSRGVNVSLFCW